MRKTRRLRPDGKTIEWSHVDEHGHTTPTIDEPDGSWRLRTKLWLQSLLVDERDFGRAAVVL